MIRGDQTVKVKAGHQLGFDAVLATSKFNRKGTDVLENWAASRSQQISAANFTSANMVSRGGASSYTSSSWIWNAYYGMFTFLPARGYGYNPYGWRLYSPQTIQYYYSPQQTYNSPYSASNASVSVARSSLSNGPMSTGSSASSNASVGAAAAPSSAGVASMGRGSVSSGGGARGR